MAIRLIKIFSIALPWLFTAVYAFLWAHALWLKPFAPKELVGIALPIPLAILTSTALQLLFNRARPYEEEGKGVQPLLPKKRRNGSFPCRQLTCAVAIATVFLPHIPVAGALLYVFSVVLGYVRFSLGWHYPSDLFASVGLGAALGSIVFFL